MADGVRAAVGGDAGGIRGLLELVEEHRGAVEYDWRSRFQIGVDRWGLDVSWGEVRRLTVILVLDPSSMTCAAARGWSKPMSREAAVLADLFDLWTKESDPPYPRPWLEPEKQVVGKGTRLTPDEFRARWAAMAEEAERRRLLTVQQGDVAPVSGVPVSAVDVDHDQV